jgi:hypothetical protein
MEDAVGDQPGRRATSVIEVVPAEQLVQNDLVQTAGHPDAYSASARHHAGATRKDPALVLPNHCGNVLCMARRPDSTSVNRHPSQLLALAIGASTP